MNLSRTKRSVTITTKHISRKKGPASAASSTTGDRKRAQKQSRSRSRSQKESGSDSAFKDPFDNFNQVFGDKSPFAQMFHGRHGMVEAM